MASKIEIDITTPGGDESSAILEKLKSDMGALDLQAEKLKTREMELAAGEKTRTSAIEGVRGAILSLNQGIQLAQAVYGGMQQVVEQTVGVYVEQADAVRTLDQINMQSAQSNSRLIETLDDYKLSADDAITAQRKLATQGQDLTIPTLAALSEEYLKLNTGAERQAFLTANFGRASAGWAEVMSQGSKAIRDRAAAVSEGLILDQQAIDKARDYQYAVDDLGDSFKALKIEVGQAVAGPLTDFLKWTSKGIEYNNLYDRAQKAGIDIGRNFFTGQVEVNGALISQADLLKLVTDRTEEHGIVVTGYHKALEKSNQLTVANSAELLDMAQRVQKYGNDLQAATAYQDAYNEALAKAPDDYDAATKAAQKAGDAIADLNNKLIVTRINWEAAWSGAKTDGDRMKSEIDLLGSGLEGLGEKGSQTWEAFLLASGTIDKPAVEAFARVQNMINTVKQMLASGFSIDVVVNWIQTGQVQGELGDRDWTNNPDIPKSWTPIGGNSIGGDYKYMGTQNGPGTPAVYWNGTDWKVGQIGGHALGGSFIVPPGFPNDSYPMRVQSGERVSITPANQVQNDLGGSNVSAQQYFYGPVTLAVSPDQAQDLMSIR